VNRKVVSANGAFHTSLGQRPGNAPGQNAKTSLRAESPRHQFMTEPMAKFQ
jgi:hypothetical protein